MPSKKQQKQGSVAGPAVELSEADPLRSRLAAQRLNLANDAPLRADGDYVLYWMIAQRRPTYNPALSRAVELSRALKRPLVVLEALRLGYRWASERLHRFVLEGMADHASYFADRSLTYYPYVERKVGEGAGLLAALAARACVVVTDEYPCFFLPGMVAAAATRLNVRMELVDGNGLLPLRAAPRAFARAYDLRRFLQKTLPAQLLPLPAADPLERAVLPRLPALPADVLSRWPAAHGELASVAGLDELLSSLPLDRSVPAVAGVRGGFRAARARLDAFLGQDLQRYADERNQPQQDVTSQLSAYLHFGHVGVFEIIDRLFEQEAWSVDRFGARAHGQKEGFWGLSPAGEAFIDELITWRELGFNGCHHRPLDYDRYDSLPRWAQKTLADHEKDPRAHVYTLEQFERGRTHDPLWNAAQMQLVSEGRIHNYLRMLWGKKILEWSRKPQDALDVMIELNNRYALDGRDPNSYSGIFWVLGRYDRAWGPERPIFGKVRYMSSDNTARKVRTKEYVARYVTR